MRMCLSWKVLVGLAGVGVGILVLEPGLLSAALPILVLAICPVSMLVMMIGMNRMGEMSGDQCAAQPMSTIPATGSRDERLAQLRHELDEVSARHAAIVAQMRALEAAETDRRPAGDLLTVERDLAPVSGDAAGPSRA